MKVAVAGARRASPSTTSAGSPLPSRSARTAREFEQVREAQGATDVSGPDAIGARRAGGGAVGARPGPGAAQGQSTARCAALRAAHKSVASALERAKLKVRRAGAGRRMSARTVSTCSAVTAGEPPGAVAPNLQKRVDRGQLRPPTRSGWWNPEGREPAPGGIEAQCATSARRRLLEELGGGVTA